MEEREPITELNSGFSSPGASPRAWSEVVAVLSAAEISGYRRCVATDGHTSRRCRPSGRMVYCISAPATRSRSRRTWS